MAFIDYGFYADVFHGTEMSAEKFGKYSERACEIVNCLSGGLAGKVVAENKPTADAAKKAACAETELLFTLGGVAYSGFCDNDIVSEQVGGAAVKYSPKGCASYIGMPVSGLAVSLLTEAGLLRRTL